MILNNYIELIYANLLGFEPYKQPPKVSWQLSSLTVNIFYDMGFKRPQIMRAMNVSKTTVERARREQLRDPQECLRLMMTNVQRKDLTL